MRLHKPQLPRDWPDTFPGPRRPHSSLFLLQETPRLYSSCSLCLEHLSCLKNVCLFFKALWRYQLHQETSPSSPGSFGPTLQPCLLHNSGYLQGPRAQHRAWHRARAQWMTKWQDWGASPPGPFPLGGSSLAGDQRPTGLGIGHSRLNGQQM